MSEELEPIDLDGLTQIEHDALFKLVDGASGDEQIEVRFVSCMILALRVFKDRQKKYGRKNIARGGSSGVLMRVGDKQARLEQFYKEKKGGEAADESVADSWIDQANYGLIGLMVHKGWWPGAKDE